MREQDDAALWSPMQRRRWAIEQAACGMSHNYPSNLVDCAWAIEQYLVGDDALACRGSVASGVEVEHVGLGSEALDSNSRPLGVGGQAAGLQDVVHERVSDSLGAVSGNQFVSHDASLVGASNTPMMAERGEVDNASPPLTQPLFSETTSPAEIYRNWSIRSLARFEFDLLDYLRSVERALADAQKRIDELKDFLPSRAAERP